MVTITARVAAFDGTVEGWRDVARGLLRDGVCPEHVAWMPRRAADVVLQPALGLVVTDADVDVPAGPRMHDDGLRVPKEFLALASATACHREPGRWHVLYRVLWRLAGREPHLLEVVTDPDVHQLHMMERAVRRAAHKMKAFIRFRALGTEDAATAVADPVFAAWFEPAQDVVQLVAPFFARRFASMRWSILTPDVCVHWDRVRLHVTPGVAREDAPRGDSLEALWRAYYAHTFNPARLRLDAMRAEMPKSYWHLLPEASLIGELARTAPARVHAMIAQVAAPPESIPSELTGAADTPRVPERRVSVGAGAHVEPGPESFTVEALRAPGAWDPMHDPGTDESCRRAAAVDARAATARSGVAIGASRVLCGVAGWTDPTILQGQTFYPAEARTPESRLHHYATRFPMVEVDATYYALPTRALAERWVERTPDHFVFNVKAHALMTGHPANVTQLPEWVRRRLPPSLRTARHVYARHLPADVLDAVWAQYLDAIEPLRAAGKLGAVFLQYPKWFRPTRDAADALRTARERLGDVPGAVELRNRGWLEGRLASRTFALLEQLSLAYTIVDAPPGMESSMPPTVAVTSPHLAVVRLHGRRTATWERPNGRVTERYRYLYDPDQLAWWVPRILDVALQHQRVHVVFNNNHANYATTNALEMGVGLMESGAACRDGNGRASRRSEFDTASNTSPRS